MWKLETKTTPQNQTLSFSEFLQFRNTCKRKHHDVTSARSTSLRHSALVMLWHKHGKKKKDMKKNGWDARQNPTWFLSCWCFKIVQNRHFTTETISTQTSSRHIKTNLHMRKIRHNIPTRLMLSGGWDLANCTLHEPGPHAFEM